MGDPPHLTASGFTRTSLLLLCLLGTLGGVVGKTISSITPVSDDPGTQLAGLQALREAWKNTPDASTTFENWGANKDPCACADENKTWAGVHCFRQPGAIFVDPAGNATEKCNISVNYLAFSGASLTGILPREISLLSDLEVLYLTDNPDLSGPIPKEIELLTQLRNIELNGNNLSGELSSTNLSGLQSLSIINIARNRFQGNIKQDYFQGLVDLNELDLSMNNFTGMCPDLSTSRNLTDLDISGNSFSGSLPSFGNLSELRTLDISGNSFSGSLPSFGNLSELRTLYISGNSFSGSLPSFGNLSELRTLDISGNSFSGSLPSFGNLPKLETLDISGNSFSGSLPCFCYLSELRTLYISGNSFSGSLPSFGNLSELRTLDISGNSFSGSLPSFGNLSELSMLNISGNSFSGSLPSFGNLSELSMLDISGNSFSGSLPSFGNLPKLETLDISGNSFSGSLPCFCYLSELRTLDISGNSFSGSLPGFGYLFELRMLNVGSNRFTGLSHNLSLFWSTLPGLNVLDLSSLEIEGPLPVWSTMTYIGPSELYLDNNLITGALNVSELVASEFGKNLNVLSLRDNNISEIMFTNDLLQGANMRIFMQGNPYCNNIWPSEDAATKCFIVCGVDCIYKPSVGSHKWKVILSSSIGSFVVILVLVVVAFAFVHHRHQRYTQVLLQEIKRANIGAKRFEYNQLRVATRNFAPEMKLGAGAFGAVYKGILENDVVVAVKQLFLETSKGKDDFLNEVFLISNLQHRNLVTLRGYCLHGKQTLLIYDFVDNCDLDKVLLSRHKLASDTFGDLQTMMMWPARMKVCRGVAQGLFYLHASSESRIIHRDIKASNILLDKSFHPKIADFGLARPMEDAKSIIYTQQCAGTMGYLAPEYACNGELSEKADIFSFGVLLLEIVSGKRNTDVTMPDDEVYLPSWAKKLYRESRLMDLQDASLVLSGNEALEVQQVLEIAMLCVQNAPEKRPTMFRVAAMLEGDIEVHATVSNDDFGNCWPEDMTCVSIDSNSECPLFPLSTSIPQSDRGPLTNGNATLELSVVHSGR